MPATLEAATQGFYDALNTMLNGDATPMLALWAHEDVSYMSPFGELLVGWEPIRASWQSQADAKLGGRIDPYELQFFSSPTLGFVVGFERGNVEIDGTSTPVNIRATSMYRIEDGRWAMIGHHTDPLG
jgi:ketosteroid isomerase-like protein